MKNISRRLGILFLSNFLFFIALYFSGCFSSENPYYPSYQKIDFNNPKIGQKCYYQYFIGENYSNPDSVDFNYYRDTLIVEITAKEGSYYIVKESITPKIEQDTVKWIIPNRDSIFNYKITIIGDTLYFTGINNDNFSSHLLNKIKSLYLKQIQDTVFLIKGWKTDPNCTCSLQGYTSSAVIYNRPYSLLNVILDNDAMASDGPGYTIIYSGLYGIVRSFTVNPWIDSGAGWDLM